MRNPSSSCGYQGRHFGATYEDGTCIDGYLWDLDSCDEPGGGLRIGGDIPCPSCNSDLFLEYHKDEIMDLGRDDFCKGHQAPVERKARFEDMQAQFDAFALEGFNEEKREHAALNKLGQ